MQLRLVGLMWMLAGCMSFKVGQALPPTVWILAHAQPSLQQESDYELASRALPGALKTIEGFYVVDKDAGKALEPLLAEGYCQYATAFVEDEWEVAQFAKKLDDVAYQNQRASKMFVRCMNYSLLQLGFDRWQKELFGTPEQSQKLVAGVDADQRTPLMFAALGLGGAINHNLSNPDMLAYVTTVKLMLAKVVELDAKHPPGSCDALCQVHLALPHIALGMVNSAASAQFGGNAQVAAEEFQKALQITGDKFLLARVLWAYRVGKMTNDRKLFHTQLVKVLETDPAIWPEQRLANEVAHRRARRYLSHEKELFQ
jgi:hypothetical protein